MNWSSFRLICKFIFILSQPDTFQTDIDSLVLNHERFAPSDAENDKGAGGEKARDSKQ